MVNADLDDKLHDLIQKLQSQAKIAGPSRGVPSNRLQGFQRRTPILLRLGSTIYTCQTRSLFLSLPIEVRALILAEALRGVQIAAHAVVVNDPSERGFYVIGKALCYQAGLPSYCYAKIRLGSAAQSLYTTCKQVLAESNSILPKVATLQFYGSRWHKILLPVVSTTSDDYYETLSGDVSMSEYLRMFTSVEVMNDLFTGTFACFSRYFESLKYLHLPPEVVWRALGVGERIRDSEHIQNLVAAESQHFLTLHQTLLKCEKITVYVQIAFKNGYNQVSSSGNKVSSSLILWQAFETAWQGTKLLKAVPVDNNPR